MAPCHTIKYQNKSRAPLHHNINATMIPRISKLVVIASCFDRSESLIDRRQFTQMPLAFQATSTSPLISPQNTATPCRSFSKPIKKSHFSTKLHSSIPEDEDLLTTPASPNLLPSLKSFLPPLPEDKFALGGDILALFVYSYLDHTVHEMCAAAARMDVSDLAAMDAGALSLPVWFDVAHVSEFGHWLNEVPSDGYAPALASGGLSFVAISTCWILSGCFSGAFLYKNTLECPPKTAVLTTGKTWMLMAALMVGLALGSDALWGQLDGMNPLSDPARGGLTKADADFIFDSLSVLAFWRWMFNYLLGYR